MQRRAFSRALLTSALFGGSALAQAQPVEGRDFERLRTPQPVPAAGKLEVIEFFSYACPHCAAFEPDLEAWARKLPADVQLRRVPVPFLFNAENFQRTYYTLETMGLVDSLQRKVFAAVHAERQRLDKPEDLAALVARNGGDAAKFLDLFKSFSVVNAVNKAKRMTSDYGIDTGPGVPALVVQGRYTTSPGRAGGSAQALAVVDALLQRARKG